MAKQIPEFISYKVSAFDTDKQTRQVIKFNEWNNIKLLQLGNNYHDDYWKSVHNFLFESDAEGPSLMQRFDWINNHTVSAQVSDPGTSATVERTFEGDHYNFHFTLPKGDKGDTGDAAGFGTPTATVNSTVGTPSVTITSSGPATAKIFNFAFSNLKGDQGIQGIQGIQGNTGPAAGFGTPTVSVNSSAGTPSATITASGPDTAKIFNFAFSNLKGDQGDQGDPADGVTWQTTAPTSDNPNELLKIVVLESEPAVKYNGYLYLIKEED